MTITLKRRVTFRIEACRRENGECIPIPLRNRVPLFSLDFLHILRLWLWWAVVGFGWNSWEIVVGCYPIPIFLLVVSFTTTTSFFFLRLHQFSTSIFLSYHRQFRWPISQPSSTHLDWMRCILLIWFDLIWFELALYCL